MMIMIIKNSKEIIKKKILKTLMIIEGNIYLFYYKEIIKI